jgi:hypothetical protein
MKNFLHNGKFTEKRVLQHTPGDLDNEQSSCEKTALRADILSYFYQKVYFAKGEVVFNGRIYTLFQRLNLSQPKELAEYFNLDRNNGTASWQSLQAKTSS